MADRVGNLFRRFVLPGLAFKAVVIGGGYATGREIAEYFLPGGFWGGLASIGAATAAWSLICAATFLFAFHIRARDYRSFFQGLLGRGWPLFELAYALFAIIILAVFGAAAGELAGAVLHLPSSIGMAALLIGITTVVAFGNKSVERLFAYVSLILYGVYIAFFVLSVAKFGGRIATAAAVPVVMLPGWLADGLIYAGYNIVGAVIILPVTRHLTSSRDALVAGAFAGPLAMLPACLFFLCMSAFSKQLSDAALPSEMLLAKLDIPWFRIAFQVMIFAALLESGTGVIHAINQRIAAATASRGRAFTPAVRAGVALCVLLFCMVIAERFGLVLLIAEGYRILAYSLFLVYVLPLLTIGMALLFRQRSLRLDPA